LERQQGLSKVRDIPIARPSLFGNEKLYVNECMNDNWISSTGRFIPEFEHAFSKLCQTKYAVATNNGTTALHLALATLGLNAGDEVIVPILTYIATANAVSYCGAKPIFVDVLEDGSIDPEKIRLAISPKTVGIIVVHLYGIPAQMSEIISIARDANIWVVEDAAEAHGASVNGSRVGGLADIGVFSFYGNKIITTGEGGALVTNNESWANRARLLRGQGMDLNRRYYFPQIGFNYRMTNIAAAIGLAQLENFDLIMDKRRTIKQGYDDFFQNYDYARPFDLMENPNSVCWLYSVVLREDLKITREALMAKLNSFGIETRPFFYLINQNPPYFDGAEFPIANHLSKFGLNLPTYYELDQESLSYICAKLHQVISECE
jgi:perosamine synthetase